eukprot:215729-Pyramimonas_sp.AAC.1
MEPSTPSPLRHLEPSTFTSTPSPLRHHFFRNPAEEPDDEEGRPLRNAQDGQEAPQPSSANKDSKDDPKQHWRRSVRGLSANQEAAKAAVRDPSTPLLNMQYAIRKANHSFAEDYRNDETKTLQRKRWARQSTRTYGVCNH